MAARPQTINEEAGLGPNWVPLDGPPIVPGQMVAAPPASDTTPVNPKYLSGTIAPNFQHDTSFTDTATLSTRAPKFDLMPLGPQQNAISAVQISSVVRSTVESIPSSATTDDDTIHLNAQTGTQYTVQLSDLNKLISMSNNAGGTVFLPPVAGTTNVVLSNHVDSPFNSGNTVVSGQTATSTATFTATNPIAIGDFLMFAVRNVSSHLDGANPTTMADSNNGTWSNRVSQIQDDPAVGADTLSFFWIQNTVAVAAGGTFTITYTATFPGTVFSPDANEFWTMTGIKTSGASAINFGNSSGATFDSGSISVSVPTTFIALATSQNGGLLTQAPANSQQRAWTAIMGGNPGAIRFYFISNINGGNVDAVWTPASSGHGFIAITQAFIQALIGDISKLTNDFSCYIENTGTGSFKLISSAPIDGVVTNTLALGKNQGLLLVWDAASQGWYTERGLAGGTGLTIQQDGTSRPAEPFLNFKNPLTATDNVGNTATDVEVKELVNAQTGASYSIADTDKGHLITFSNTGAVAVTLPQAGAANAFAAGWFADVENLNQGVVTITPTTSTINGLSTFVLYMNQGARIVSDGTNYFVIQGAATAGISEPVNAQTGASYTVSDTDRGKLVTFSNTGAVAVTLPQAATSSKFASGWFADFENLNTGTVTITPTTSTINGVATYVLTKGQGVRIISDGTNYQVVQGSPSKDIANGYAGLDANAHLTVADVQTAVDARTTASEAVNDNDRGKLVTFTNASAVAATIAQAGASSLFISGWYCYLQNKGPSVVTLTPTTSTVNGDATLVLQKNQGGTLVSDGSNYFFLGANLGDQNTTLTDGFVMVYDGTNKKWFASAPGSISGISATALRGITIAVSAATPSNQDVLQYNSTNNDWEPVLLDGLVHGDSIWDVDPVVVKLYDEFFGGTTATAGAFGNLGWAQTGSVNATPIYWEGGPPHVGVMVMPPPSATAQQTSGIIKQAPNTIRGGMPLLDYPGWKMEWVWRWGYIQSDLGTGLSSAAISSTTKFCNYIGISDTGMFGATLSRPFSFIGLRFDTDAGSQQTNASGTMTTPGLQIADTTMKLECIANPNNAGNQDRTNAQGIVVLQKNSASSTSVAAGGTLTAAFNTAIGQNNMIVVLVAVGGVTAPTVADTSGTSFTKNASQNDAGSAFSCYIFSGTTSSTPVTSSTDTITVTNHNAGAQSMAIFIYEIMSTQGGVLSFDSSAGGNGTGTAATTGNITLAGQDELVFEITGVGTTTEAITNATASGWLLDTTAVNLTTGLFSAGASWAQTTLETVKAGSSTLAASKPWALLAGAFKTTISSFFDTGVLPVVGQWYRLELKCVVAGQVIVTLFSNNTQIATHTFTVPKYTLGTSVANSATVQASGTLAQFQPAFVPGGAGNFVGRTPFVAGSIITLAGLTGAGPTTLNGSHTVASGIFNGNITGVTFYTNVASFGSTNSKGTISGYAGYSPICMMGNIAISSGFQTDFNLEIDMFKFVWDTSLATSPLTMNANYSRYVATPPDTGQ